MPLLTCCLQRISTTEEEIETGLRSINLKMAVGPDNISLHLLKQNVTKNLLSLSPEYSTNERQKMAKVLETYKDNNTKAHEEV